MKAVHPKLLLDCSYL